MPLANFAGCIFLLAMSGRETPELEVSVLFSELEPAITGDFADWLGVSGPSSFVRDILHLRGTGQSVAEYRDCQVLQQCNS